MPPTKEQVTGFAEIFTKNVTERRVYGNTVNNATGFYILACLIKPCYCPTISAAVGTHWTTTSGLSWLPEHDLTLTFQGLAHVPQPLQTQIADSLALWQAYWQAQTVKTVRILF